jgi:hypothetical protein
MPPFAEVPFLGETLMKRVAIVLTLLAVGLSALLCSTVAAKSPGPPRVTVQIAVLLDTSNSMDGLIAQAKTQLWSIVNEFVRAKKNGRPPAMEVALFEYGKNTLSPGEGFIRMILPLTDELDRVSEELFALRTSGGDEYCGWVIREATNRLKWSQSPDVYKAIFIAGNEPFTQGSVDFHASCKSAIERGIIVNTIFCGSPAEGTQTGWKDGALLADGRYLSIDQNQKIAEIPAPQDAEIAKLGVELNKTYLPFGKMGQAGQARQCVQDANASASSVGAIVNRSISKGNAVYCNDAWDLVDAIKNGHCKLEDVKDEDLPPDMVKLDKAARAARVDRAAKERQAISARINELSRKREEFLTAERKKRANAKEDTLDQAIVKAIRDQARRQHFTFE